MKNPHNILCMAKSFPYCQREVLCYSFGVCDQRFRYIYVPN